jgi:nucleoside-diphosphate-sugar epimerase
MKNILVLGAGGFIGNAIVERLVSEGHFVRGVDFRYPKFNKSAAQDFVIGDLRHRSTLKKVLVTFNNDTFDEIYHFAADMGGAEYIFTGINDADILTNSMGITIHLLREQAELNRKLKTNKTKILYASSACVYPEHNQSDPLTPDCREDTVYPASPDSDYGWEKLFGERIIAAYNRNYHIPIRIARYHNVYGPGGEYEGGREKAPAALCRKVLTTVDNEITIFGDGNQTRSFLYIDDAVEGTLRLMNSDYKEPINMGSEEIISINDFVDMIASIENKTINKVHKINGPLGVRGRNSNNDLMRSVLKWEPPTKLKDGITKTYNFIKSVIHAI